MVPLFLRSLSGTGDNICISKVFEFHAVWQIKISNILCKNKCLSAWKNSFPQSSNGHALDQCRIKEVGNSNLCLLHVHVHENFWSPILIPEPANTMHREETTGEIVKKLETEVFESNMDEDEMDEDEAEEEDMEANMEKAFEETVKEEVENNNREDKIMEK